MTVAYWAAVAVSMWREAVIAERIGALGFETFLPRYRLRKTKTKPRRVVALFPGYCLADLDSSAPWQAIRRTPGVVGIVQFGDKPARCSEEEIARLQAARQRDGLVNLGRLLPPRRPRPRFRSGERVRVTSGPLTGLHGSFAGARGAERVALLLAMLGARRVVEVAGADVVAVR